MKKTAGPNLQQSSQRQSAGLQHKNETNVLEIFKSAVKKCFAIFTICHSSGKTKSTSNIVDSDDRRNRYKVSGSSCKYLMEYGLSNYHFLFYSSRLLIVNYPWSFFIYVNELHNWDFLKFAVSTDLSSESNNKNSSAKWKYSSSYTSSRTAASGQLGAGNFSFEEIYKATDKFSPQNQIGEGAFGIVYKGRLNDGPLVAIKRAKKVQYNINL